MIPRLSRSLPVILVVASLSVLAACGPTSGGTAAAPAEQTNTTAGGETGGGTEVSIAYTDAAHHYRISGPGRMTANPDGTASFIGPVQAPAAVTVSGHRTIKFVYQWTAGTNAVTGKANQLITARYYVTKDASRLAVVSYASAANQYDPQGADDVANTFAWLP